METLCGVTGPIAQIPMQDGSVEVVRYLHDADFLSHVCEKCGHTEYLQIREKLRPHMSRPSERE